MRDRHQNDRGTPHPANTRAGIEVAGLEHRQQAMGDVARFVEREPAAADIGQAVDDDARMVARSVAHHQSEMILG